MSVTLDGVLQTLSAMERYFRGGTRWGRYALHDDRTGNKCLVGAALSVRASNGATAWFPGEVIDAARHYIEMAIRERKGPDRGGFFGYGVIETFNDAQRSYRDIATVIDRAKELATASYHAQQRPAPPVVPVIDMMPEPVRHAPVMQILPPYTRPSLPPPDGSSSGFFAGLLSAPSPVAVPPVRPRIAANPWTTPRRLPR